MVEIIDAQLKLFQSLIGRLKTLIAIYLFLSRGEFQSLIGRLKTCSDEVYFYET